MHRLIQVTNAPRPRDIRRGMPPSHAHVASHPLDHALVAPHLASDPQLEGEGLAARGSQMSVEDASLATRGINSQMSRKNLERAIALAFCMLCIAYASCLLRAQLANLHLASHAASSPT